MSELKLSMILGQQYNLMIHCECEILILSVVDPGPWGGTTPVPDPTGPGVETRYNMIEINRFIIAIFYIYLSLILRE